MIASKTVPTLLGLSIAILAGTPVLAQGETTAVPNRQVFHRTVKVGGLDHFYREAGPKDALAIVQLHGFPTSSHMFRNLIPAPADRDHVVAPDYPGFGNSSAPPVGEFEYTFDNLAKVIDAFTVKVGLTRYALHVQDDGSPVGYRLAVKHPERVTARIVPNGSTYDEGIANDFWVPVKAYWKDRTEATAAPLRKFVSPEATTWRYLNGVRNVEAISPDNWNVDQPLLDRPGNAEIQAALLYSDGSNPPLYPEWQAYFRKHQPPTLVIWGKNDAIFPAEGAHPYKRDLKDVEFHRLDTGHFALEEDGATIAGLIRELLSGRGIGKPGL